MSYQPKQQSTSLEPSSNQPNDVQVFQDPFDTVYANLTPQDRKLIEKGHTQILAERAIEIKGMIAGQIMGDISTGIAQIFSENCRVLDVLIERIEATPSGKYAVEFGHRRRHQLAINLERLESAITDSLIKEVTRSPYPDESVEQKSRLRRIWDALMAPGDA